MSLTTPLLVEIIEIPNPFKTFGYLSLAAVIRKPGLKKISKPGLRIHAASDKLPKVLNGLGIAIISTSKGVVSDKQARALGVGGEVLAYVW